VVQSKGRSDKDVYAQVLAMAEKSGVLAMDHSGGDPCDPDFVYFSAMHEAFMEVLDLLDEQHLASILRERGRCNPSP